MLISDNKSLSVYHRQPGHMPQNALAEVDTKLSNVNNDHICSCALQLLFAKRIRSEGIARTSLLRTELCAQSDNVCVFRNIRLIFFF